MSDPFLAINQKNLDCQREIYIADILNKHIVCSPSILHQLSFSFLKDIAHYSQLFILDPRDFVDYKGITQMGFFVH